MKKSDSVKSVITDSNILKAMLQRLIKVNKKEIWNKISPRMLYKYYLSDPEAIKDSFVVAELDAINEVYKEYAG